MARFPLYTQTFGFSCGPASLMMVLKDLDPGIALDRSEEISIWRDANLHESRATSSYGLALAALRRGFKTRIRANSEGIGFNRRLVEHFPQIKEEFMELLFSETRKQARILGVEEIPEGGCIDQIEEEIARGIHPIVLVSTSLMDEIEEIPHWIVVVAADAEYVKIANPETGALETYPRDKFCRSIGFRGYRCMISIFR
ncbi:MAG: peptidase C39 family protein [Thermoplasmatota archaeon]